jgi:uncharacterized membrane protein (TIGR02234 family)
MSGPTADQAARLRSRALLPGLLGGALALVTAAQPWWRATGEGVSVAFTGTQTTAGLASALGVVALAGWLLVLVLRTRGRRLVGLMLALTGAGGVAVGLLGLRPSAEAVRTQVRQVSLADQFALVATGWSYGYAATGLLVLVGGLLVVATAPRWPRRADRFTRSAAAAAATTAEDDPAAVWRAQDAGLDPTTVSEPEHRLAPDVRPRRLRDTMGSADEGTAPPPSE